MKAQVRNLSGSAVDAYTVSWSVVGPGGNEVFTDEVAGGPINPQAAQTVTASTTFGAAAAGDYLAQCLVHADNDAGNYGNPLSAYFSYSLHVTMAIIKIFADGRQVIGAGRFNADE